jgi:hypothetical protein
MPHDLAPEIVSRAEFCSPTAGVGSTAVAAAEGRDPLVAASPTKKPPRASATNSTKAFMNVLREVL